MGSNEIKIYGPQMKRALLLYYKFAGVSQPDPFDVGCLTAIGIFQIDRRNLGFKATSFLGMASFLVPALLDPNHPGHQETLKAVTDCKSQFAPPPPAGAVELTAAAKPKRSLAKSVDLAKAGPKLPHLGKSLGTFARLAKEKAAPRGGKAKARPAKPK